MMNPIADNYLPDYKASHPIRQSLVIYGHEHLKCEISGWLFPPAALVSPFPSGTTANNFGSIKQIHLL